jgi:Photoprotection regulator fluorescence recovery protein
MSEDTWTHSEKKIARRVFLAALERELAEVMAQFKSRAAAAVEPDDIWSMEEYIAQTRRNIDEKYDYRYSRLDMLFGWLLREKRIDEADLEGFSEDRLAYIRRFTSS